MKLGHSHLCVVLVALQVVAHGAASQPEKYWDDVFPNVPIPDTIKELLQPEEEHDPKARPVATIDGGSGVGVSARYPGGSTNVGVGKGGVGVSTEYKGGSTTAGAGKGGVGVRSGYNGGSTTVGIGKEGVGVSSGYNGGSTTVGVGKGGVGVSSRYKGGSTTVGVGKGGVGVSAGYKGGSTNVNVGKGGVGVNVGYPKGATTVGVRNGGVGVTVGPPGGNKTPQPVYVAVQPFGLPFTYQYAATDTQVNNDPDVTLFFEEKDMRYGHSFDLHFARSSDKEKLLPRQEADMLPFSLRKLPEIYRRFSVRPNSLEADTLKGTLMVCEDSGVAGETKYCATSLESMIDFVVLKLGKRVHALSTFVRNSKKQKYTIVEVKSISKRKLVACHKQPYAYAVFYCHSSETARAHWVTLRGADGIRVKALAVCHSNTAAWNPKHVAFKILQVKPGMVSICHFLPEEHVLWTKM